MGIGFARTRHSTRDCRQQSPLSCQAVLSEGDELATGKHVSRDQRAWDRWLAIGWKPIFAFRKASWGLFLRKEMQPERRVASECVSSGPKVSSTCFWLWLARLYAKRLWLGCAHGQCKMASHILARCRLNQKRESHWLRRRQSGSG